MPYISQTGSAPGGRSYRSQTVGAAEADGGGFSLFGLLGNIGSGIADVAGGAVDLVGATAHDTLKGWAEVWPGEQAIESDPIQTWEIAKALPGAVASDFARRYGPLLPGGEPASRTLGLLYEEPVSYALDALGLGSAAGKGAQIAGRAAIAGTEGAAAAAEALGRLKALGLPARAAERASIRTGLEAVGRGESLTARLLSEATYRRVGQTLEPSVSAINPVKRLAFNAPLERLMSEPISGLQGRVDTMRTGIERYLHDRGASLDDAGQVLTKAPSKELTRMATDYRIARALLDDAKARGLSRIGSDRAATSRISQVARRLSGELNAEFLLRRQQRMGQVVATLRPWLAEHPEIASKAAGIWQRLDLDVAGAERAGWAGRPLEWDALDAGPTVEIGAAAPVPYRTVLDPAVREAADPQLLARTDELVQGLLETRDRWLADPTLAELGWDIPDQVDSISRLIDHLNGGVERRVAVTRGAEIDPALLAMDDMRLLNLEQSRGLWEQPGTISPTQMLERAYLPLRAKYGARFNHVDDVFEGGPETKALDDALRASGEAPPVYFPHIDPGDVGPWEFFRGKRPVGGARMAADPNLKRNTARLLEEGSYITDPLEAYSRRAARAVRAEETYRTLMAFSTRLGRPISAAEDLGTNEVLFAPEILRRLKRTSLRTQDLVDDLTSQGVSREQAVWQAVKEVTEANQDELAELLGGGAQIKMWAVPRAAAERLGDAARYAQGWGPKGIQMYFDSAMQGWRQLTLFTRPAYVANQFLGNTAFAILQGSGLKAPLEVLARRMKQALETRLGRTIDDATLARLEDLPGFDELGHGLFGSLQQTYVPRNAAFAGTRVGRAVERGGQSRAGRLGKRFMEAERRAAMEVDDAFRASGLVSAAERAMGVGEVRRVFRRFRGMQHRIDRLLKGGFGDDPMLVRQALDEAKLFFGDYGSMGAFERHVIRRYLFPWWGFTRHNLNLLARFPIEYPGRAEIMRGIAAADEEYRAQYGPIPEWLDASVPLGPPGAEVTFLSMRGGSPFEGVFQPWTSQLGPIPKIALERATGENLFTGLPFTSEDVVTPFGSDQPYQVIRDEAGNVTGVEQLEGSVLPSPIEHLLRQFPPYSYAERFVAGDASTYDTTNLVGLLAGEGVKRDETGAPIDQEGRLAVLAGLLGLPLNVYDLGGYQERLGSEQQAALTAALARFGQG